MALLSTTGSGPAAGSVADDELERSIGDGALSGKAIASGED
jgi:hypothetical protein